jgi:hypothetical protein
MRPSLTRRLANAVAACALRALPVTRVSWARHMHSEMAYLGDRAALRWALGCGVAAVKMRITSMMIGDLKISSYVLVPEMLMCFLPLCLLWLLLTVGSVSFMHISGADLHKYFLDPADGRVVLLNMGVAAIVSLLGPIGLIASLWSIFSRRPLKNRFLGAACIVGPVILGLVYFASATFMDPRATQNADTWRALVLLALPALAAVHLMRIGLWPTRNRAGEAASA